MKKDPQTQFEKKKSKHLEKLATKLINNAEKTDKLKSITIKTDIFKNL